MDLSHLSDAIFFMGKFVEYVAWDQLGMTMKEFHARAPRISMDVRFDIELADNAPLLWVSR